MLELTDPYFEPFHSLLDCGLHGLRFVALIEEACKYHQAATDWYPQSIVMLAASRPVKKSWVFTSSLLFLLVTPDKLCYQTDEVARSCSLAERSLHADAPTRLSFSIRSSYLSQSVYGLNRFVAHWPRNARWCRGVGQERLYPLDFEPAEFGRTGPLLHPFAVRGELRRHSNPPVLVLAGCTKRGLKRVGALFLWYIHKG